MAKKDQLSIKFKRLQPDAWAPEYSSEGAAGLDLRCTSLYYDSERDYIEYGTGVAVAIPEGHVGLLFPRSSISKTPHSLCNSVGVIDADYRGEVMLRFRNSSRSDADYNAYTYGDKVGQLVVMPIPQVTLEEVEDLDDTDRGSGGFGSTGR